MHMNSLVPPPPNRSRWGGGQQFPATSVSFFFFFFLVPLPPHDNVVVASRQSILQSWGKRAVICDRSRNGSHWKAKQKKKTTRRTDERTGRLHAIADPLPSPVGFDALFHTTHPLLTFLLRA